MFLYGKLELRQRETPPHSDLYKKGVGGNILKDSEVLMYLVDLVDNDAKKLWLIMEFLKRRFRERESREAARDLIERVRHDRP
jgi:hypothetical protein